MSSSMNYALPTSPRPIATFDISHRCPLRCRHCYFFGEPSPNELPDEEFLGGAATLRERLGIRSAFWVGGEPLLRSDLLRRAVLLFQRNCVATSGMLPIPTDWPVAWLVSLDGLRDHHEMLRGTGTFDVVIRNARTLPLRTAVLSTTITAVTLGAIDDLPQMVEESGAAGAVVGFHVGRAGDRLRVDGATRDQAIDRIHALAHRWPGVVLTSEAAIEALRPSSVAAQLPCIYRDRAIAFDPALFVKDPCTFGARASCESCGCPVVALHRARELGDIPSHGLLRAAFPLVEAATSAPS